MSANLVPQKKKKKQANLKANPALAVSRAVWALELGREEESTPSYKGRAEFKGDGLIWGRGAWPRILKHVGRMGSTWL